MFTSFRNYPKTSKRMLFASLKIMLVIVWMNMPVTFIETKLRVEMTLSGMVV